MFCGNSKITTISSKKITYHITFTYKNMFKKLHTILPLQKEHTLRYAVGKRGRFFWCGEY